VGDHAGLKRRPPIVEVRARRAGCRPPGKRVAAADDWRSVTRMHQFEPLVGHRRGDTTRRAVTPREAKGGRWLASHGASAHRPAPRDPLERRCVFGACQPSALGGKLQCHHLALINARPRGIERARGRRLALQRTGEQREAVAKVARRLRPVECRGSLVELQAIFGRGGDILNISIRQAANQERAAAGAGGADGGPDAVVRCRAGVRRHLARHERDPAVVHAQQGERHVFRIGTRAGAEQKGR
jgi:hypothetical protein